MVDKLRELVDALRRRAAGLKAAANGCSSEDVFDRFVLRVRADEVERCADAIEAAATEAEEAAAEAAEEARAPEGPH